MRKLCQEKCATLGGHLKTWVQLGCFAAELGTKPSNMTQNKAKRTNGIDYFPRLCKQEVTGSAPVAAANYLLANQSTVNFLLCLTS